jgi:hypothetical protein
MEIKNFEGENKMKIYCFRCGKYHDPMDDCPYEQDW